MRVGILLLFLFSFLLFGDCQVQYEHPFHSILLESRNYPVLVRVIPFSGEFPQVEIEAKGSLFDDNDILVTQTDSSFVLSFENQIDSLSSSSSSTALKATLLLPIALFLCFFFSFTKRSFLTVVLLSVIIAIFSGATVVHAEGKNTTTHFQVTVFVPQDWHWDEFVVHGSGGEVIVNASMNLAVSSAVINLCVDSYTGQSSSSVSLINTSVTDSLSICSSVVYFSGELGSQVDVDIQQSEYVSFEVLGDDFSGHISLSSDHVELIGGDQCEWSSVSEALCGSGRSSLNIDSEQISLYLPDSPEPEQPLPAPSQAPEPSPQAPTEPSQAPEPSPAPSSSVVEPSRSPNQESASPNPQASLAATQSSIPVAPSPSPEPSYYYETYEPQAPEVPGYYGGQVGTTCPVGFRDPDPAIPSPTSNPVSNNWQNPGAQTSLIDASDWIANYQGNNPTISNYNANTIQSHSPQWYGARIYLQSIADVTISQGVPHTFSFSLWQGAQNSFNGHSEPLNQVPLSISLVVMDFVPAENWKWMNDIPNGQCLQDCTVLHFEQLVIDSPFPTTESSALSLSSVFTLNYSGSAVILLHIEQANIVNAPGGNYFYLADLLLEQESVNRFFPTPLQQSSPYVDVPVSPVLPPVPRTDCPHLRNDLVDWHDASIWPNGVVPSNYQDVSIPAGLSVLISSCSFVSNGPNPIINTIYIPTGTELIFADADIDITIGAIHVNGGHLWIGSETCRIRSNIRITIGSHGYALPEPYGRKGITSRDSGIMDIHGRQYQRTWTRLAAPAYPNDDRVLVFGPVDWEVGQQVVITTTIWEDHWNNQNEVMTIAAIDGQKIQFTERLQFYHHAGEEYQAEVALISRNILIQGDESSEATRVGGHILSNGAIGRFSGVQAYRMGQTNILGKYPFHFHMMGESPESYFKDCSVYHSFYRCFTIHGTNSTLIQENTAFDVLGHCYYIEDGVEEHNVFNYNFAAYPQPLREVEFNGFGQGGKTIYQDSDLLIPADAAVSGFYISNANNEFYGNSASGGWTGYSFINFPEPLGHFVGTDIVPQERPLALFYGNTAHSASYQWELGACIYTGGYQQYQGSTLVYNVGRKARNTLGDNGPFDFVPMIFEETRTFLCSLGLNHWGDRVETHGFAAHDVTKGMAMFGEAYIHNAVIDGHSSNPLANRPSPTRAFEFYDTFVQTIFDDVVIMNLEETPEFGTDKGTYAIVSMTHSDKFKPQGISASRGVVFDNVWSGGEIGNTILDTGASRFFNIMDFDGSLLGTNTKTIIGSANDQFYGSDTSRPIKEWWNIDPACVLYSQYNVYACPQRAGQEIANLLLDVNQLTNDVTIWPGVWFDRVPSTNVGTVSHFGYTGNARRSTIMTDNPGVTGVTGDNGWYAFFDNGTPKEIFVRVTQVPVVNGQPTHVILALKYKPNIVFDISTQHRLPNKAHFNSVVQRASSFSEMYYDPDGLKYYTQPSPSGEQWLFLKIVYRHFDENTSESTGYFERNGVRLYDVTNFYSYRIATCYSSTNDCPTYTGSVPVWQYVQDEVPPFVSQLL